MTLDDQNQEMPEDPQLQDIREQPEPISSSDYQETPAIRFALEQINFAEHLDEDTLDSISTEAKKGFEADLTSRAEWEQDMEEWTKLAKQTREMKTYPWPKASNIKFPLLTTAAMQFAARAYPSLVPSNGQVVKSVVIGEDKDGQKEEMAIRVSKYMSYQLLNEMKGWEEDMDKMLLMLPIVGTMFKKTYWDPLTQTNKSCLIHPKNLVVNYWTECLDTASRVSEIIELTAREIKERQLAGIYLEDVELPTQRVPSIETRLIPDTDLHPVDGTTPYQIIEQHTYIDIDDSGYPLPFIVTFLYDSGAILRISPRYDEKGIHYSQKDPKKVVKVDAISYYTKFSFIPNPDGGFYDIGFGVLLGPINESVNTIINQLVDAGSLSNLQSGFIGKGLRIKMGETRFQPGEWKAVNATGDDLKKQIFPLPVKEPSATLFQLMGSLVTSGKELASVAEIFVGKMPGQNTPATTTMATIEQGMKVFTAVYKRIYRSLAEEFLKLYRLNEVYLNPETYAHVLDGPVGPKDFNREDYDICPGADPTAVSQTEKLMKAQGLMELLPTGMLDPVEVIKRILEAQEQPNVQALLNQQTQQGQPPQQQPDPKMLELQMKSQAMQQKAAIDQQAAEQNSQLAERDMQTKEAMVASKIELAHQKQQADMQLSAVATLHKARAGIVATAAKTQQDLVHKEQTHQQAVRHSEEKSKLAQQSQKNSSTTGKNRK